jgi:hypothetical protein
VRERMQISLVLSGKDGSWPRPLTRLFRLLLEADMARTLMLILACATLPNPAVAQRDDAAYCAQLGNLALRYTGSAGGEGGLRPDFTTLGAIDDCNKGNTATGIAVLERKLRNNGFTLPKR